MKVFISVTLIKKENKIFLIYKEIQKGSVAKSYMIKYLRISSYIRKTFLMTLQLIPSEFPYMWGKFRFLFISALLIRVLRKHTFLCDFPRLLERRVNL
jgi:hypothetical protein